MLGSISSRIHRELDSFEEFFYCMEQIAPTLHIHAVHLTGSTAREDWQQSWQSLHASNPLLQTRIAKKNGTRPIFVANGRNSPLAIEEWADGVALEWLAEDAFAHPFFDGSQDVVRAKVLYRPGECLLVLAAHHSLYDGMGSLLLLQDLLEQVAGESDLRGPRTWTSLRDAIGVSSRDGYASTASGDHLKEGKAVAAAATGSAGSTKVRHLTLDRYLTERLEKKARVNGATPHGMLMAAFQLAGARMLPSWAEEGVNCNTAHSVRASIPSGGEMTGMLTMPIITRLQPIAGQSFWESARAALKDVNDARTAPAKQAFVEAMDVLTADEVTPVEFLQKVVESPIQYPLMITNYASYRPRTDYGSLKIVRLLTGVDGGGPHTQTIGACTIDGALDLTLVSKNPMDGLLDRARDILISI